MSKFVFTHEPPPHWNELCSRHGDLFNTPEWHSVLSKGFGSKTLYGWHEAASIGVSITVFKAGPFRIGYLGFPVGGTVGNGTISPYIISDFKDARFPVKLHCLRLPTSAFMSEAELPLPSQISPETAIEKLQEWRPEINLKALRAARKAKKSPLKVVDVSASSQSEAIFCLYRDTIVSHNGNMRYTLNYFYELVNLAKTRPSLRCLLAMMDDRVAGFIVVACHNRTAYYLHGGIDRMFNQFRPSDLLFYEAIEWAKQFGMESFNMMASPLKQPSLIRYKEKWGGVTMEQHTYELVLHQFLSAMFKAATSLYQRMPTFR